ncbi:MAG: hypothetical protein DDT21_02141 [Syntrophomonadaceae bacterium]|nr:hypothetical protein [Bacillota bacterium]
MKKKYRIVSVLLTVILLMSVFVAPVAAGRENGRGRGEERGRGRQSARQIQYLDAEVRVIDGQPVLRYETEDGYADIPFDLPAYAISADGQKVAVERQGDAILLPTEDGFEAVPLKDFSVVMMNGQIMLLAEVNPIWKLLPIALVKVGLAGFTVHPHFVDSFVKRFINKGIPITTGIANIVTVLVSGQRFVDTGTGRRVVFHAGLRMAVVIARTSRTLITVMDDVNIHIKMNRKVSPWIPHNWNW